MEKVQRLYDEGRTEDALEMIEAALEKPSLTREEYKELHAIKAWCHYRRKEYELCRRTIIYSGGNVVYGNQMARECLAQLTAYVDEDDALLKQISSELPERVVVQNAFMIRARHPDAQTTSGEVLEVVNRFLDNTEIAATNLLNNASRFFYAKGVGTADLLMALGLMELAFTRYGEGKQNLHHRAAALFWQSKIMEDLRNVEAAKRAAKGSFWLWERQVELDPTNPAFQTGFENSKKRLRELGVDLAFI